MEALWQHSEIRSALLSAWMVKGRGIEGGRLEHERHWLGAQSCQARPEKAQDPSLALPRGGAL
eukprot:scaffold27799_cov45-Phaeocystis_antarctica.AAC.2